MRANQIYPLHKLLIVVSVTGALGMAGCASSGDTEQQGKRIHEVASGTEFKVADYYFVSESCQQIPFTLQVTSPARHGTLIVRPATKVLAGKTSTLGRTNKKCDGTQVDSKQLIYQSRTGYVGPDRFEIYVRNDLHEDAQRFVPYRIKVLKKQ